MKIILKRGSLNAPSFFATDSCLLYHRQFVYFPLQNLHAVAVQFSPCNCASLSNSFADRRAFPWLLKVKCLYILRSHEFHPKGLFRIHYSTILKKRNWSSVRNIFTEPPPRLSGRSTLMLKSTPGSLFVM